ncbi:MAG: proton-conducting transporter membrane subunit [Atribacterota bacterium]|nr:proton-conducting transporter membrane subunit [Atribacterota bacterium]
MNSNLPLLAVIIPFFFAAAVVSFIRGRFNQTQQLRLILVIIFIVAIAMTCSLGLMLFEILKGNTIHSAFWSQMVPFGLRLQVDGLSISIAIVSFLLWFAVSIYSISYIKTDLVRYYSLLLIVLGAVQGTVLAKDLINFYVFFEMTTVATYFLIIHKRNNDAFQAGYKYILMTLIGAFLILLSIILVYADTGSYEVIVVTKSGGFIAPVLFLLGCFIKAGVVPLHTWLPDAHPAAPSPVSAFLSGMMIKIGAYGIIKFIFPILNFDLPASNFGEILSSLIISIGVASMLIGVFLALVQTDVKRLLAYHSISQMGYILLGIGLGTKLGLAGGLYHLVNHAMFKGLLFLCMGAVTYSTGTRKLDNLGGLWKKMPITTSTCIIAALAISGIPPFNGFASKTVLVEAVANYNFVLKFVMMVTAALTFASFLKLISYTFFGEPKRPLITVKEVPLLMQLPMIVLAILCVLLGINAQFVLDRFIAFAIAGLVQSRSILKIEFWSQGTVLDALFIIALGFVAYIAASKLGLIGIERKEFEMGSFMAKLAKYLSMDRIYCNIAILIDKLCKKLDSVHSRDLNIHLSWVILTLIALFLTLFFVIV